jgi:hypothetical protein
LPAKVGKSDGEGTLAGTRGNGEDAPIPAVRVNAIEPPESTHRRPSGWLHFRSWIAVANRDHVEQMFTRGKQVRLSAIRCDKTALSFLGLLNIAATKTIWRNMT